MRNIDETTITAAVLQRLEGCGDARLKDVLGALVRHLHDFVREVKLTEAEWKLGIDFLTETGQMCDAKRQEFILLSDTLGVSMLTMALNQAKPEGATEATVFGPFHTDDAPALPQHADIAGDAPGRPLFVTAGRMPCSERRGAIRPCVKRARLDSRSRPRRSRRRRLWDPSFAYREAGRQYLYGCRRRAAHARRTPGRRRCRQGASRRRAS